MHGMERIVVIGNSGAGKSTFAADLACRLQLPYIATDTFYWEAGWVASPSAVVRQRIVAAVGGELWVVDGNCITEREVVWGNADAVIWLDYSLPRVMQRVCMRNIRWLVTQERVWSGNRMTWSRAWSGIRHAARTYAQKRASYPGCLAEFPHLAVVRFRTPGEAKQWLARIAACKS